jgi:gentisate 1,2-dioxygenase
MNDVGYVNELWAQEIVSWEYSAAATPDLKEVPIQPFPASLHEQGKTRVIALDLSKELETPYLATSPNLLANYVRICEGESISTAVIATSEVFFVMRGSGRTETEEGTISWKQGDAFTLPCNQGIKHYANEDTALYWTHDGPLLQYLGVVPTKPQFKPSFFSKEYLHEEIEQLREVALQEKRNRVGIILGNVATTKTKTITHTMWSLFNLLPAGEMQKAHRHQSVALDLAVVSGPDTYTLIGKKVDENGDIIDPVKAMWATNTVFVTPPGLWHSHHNESNQDGYVFPVQDAGLHSYMRTLDIQFTR